MVQCCLHHPRLRYWQTGRADEHGTLACDAPCTIGEVVFSPSSRWRWPCYRGMELLSAASSGKPPKGQQGERRFLRAAVDIGHICSRLRHRPTGSNYVGGRRGERLGFSAFLRDCVFVLCTDGFDS